MENQNGPALNFYSMGGFIFSTDVPEERKALFGSFVKAWGAIETPNHNRKVSVKKDGRHLYDFWYTDLAGIFNAARPAFSANGLAIRQDAYTHKENGKPDEIHVSTMFIHESGHYMQTQTLTQIASKNMQDLGGQITYLKRYSLSAALGLATEADNDAPPEGAQIQAEPVGEQAKKTQQQNEQAVRNSEATAGSAAASDAQKKKIHAMLNNIGKLQGYDAAKVYERIQEVYKTDTKIDDLGKQAASSLIRLLGDYEIEDPTKRKNLY